MEGAISFRLTGLKHCCLYTNVEISSPGSFQDMGPSRKFNLDLSGVMFCVDSVVELMLKPDSRSDGEESIDEAAVLYCTLLWTIPLSKSRPTGISFDTAKSQSGISSSFDTFTAVGIIVFAFRGHNLVLEIQATLPSRFPMWKGVNFAYPIIVICLFPLALAGYWAYGNKALGSMDESRSLKKRVH
ncbi:hypothetical protein IFM89_011180 [Coptis chinensis]|uniref:Amino acid transporter transmembrane domain-containing protein n=1 Tax=Coptis chinensis TaxID=261450 RepID=A0A835LR01_9MAGN|nr:hypothetical protein IFM89_011180 [Coptis chinensis]